MEILFIYPAACGKLGFCVLGWYNKFHVKCQELFVTTLINGQSLFNFLKMIFLLQHPNFKFKLFLDNNELIYINCLFYD